MAGKWRKREGSRIETSDGTDGQGKEEQDLGLLEKIQPQGGITFRYDRYIVSGGGYETCIHIYELPQQVSDHWLSNVCSIKDTVASVDIATENILEVKKNLNKSMKEQNVRFHEAHDFGERLAAEQRLKEMEALYEEIVAMGEVIKILKIRIYVADRSFAALEEKVKGIMATLESNGYRPTIFLNEMQAEWRSIYQPYEEQQKEVFAVYGQPLQSLAVAGGNPFHFSSLEDPYGDYLGSTPCGGNVLYDEFIKTQTRLYYNSLVVGTMGSGKSTLLKKRFLARAIRGDYVRAFDITGEFTLLTKTLGGKVLKLDGSAGILNPLEILRSGETEGQSYMRHISKMSTIYRFLAGQAVQVEEILDFENILRELYESLDLSPRAVSGIEQQITGLPASRYPTFSVLLEFIRQRIQELQQRKYGKLEQALAEQHILQYDKIRRVLENIVRNYGDLFDGPTTIDNISDEQIVTFDMSSVKEMKAEIFDAQIFNMVSFCWGNCVTNGKIMKERYEAEEIDWEDIVRFLIIIDESHRWINTEKPHALDQILVYLREARKFFGGILLASQSIRDYVPEGSSAESINKIKTVFELTQYKFLFHQDSNVLPLIDTIFAGVLTESQKVRIPKLEIGENVLCIASDKNLEFKVYLTKEEERLFAGGA
ncbi:hypothetical protein DXA96_18790 [Lachnospiraceae bacterium OF09-33XD]|nr:hypothetical protein DXA96_18790 [Lachnospiraceae bacterium OF09-33XD]